MGLYNRPPVNVADCAPCNALGLALSGINDAFVSLFEIRDIWINKWELQQMQFFEMLSRLIEVYPYFISLFESIQDLANTPIVLGFTDGVPVLGEGGIDLGGETDEEGENIEYVLPDPTPVFDTFSRNFVAMYGMFDALPGSTCFELGYKWASITRFASG